MWASRFALKLVDHEALISERLSLSHGESVPKVSFVLDVPFQVKASAAAVGALPLAAPLFVFSSVWLGSDDVMGGLWGTPTHLPPGLCGSMAFG